jgi:hypothetical protein
VIHFLGGGLLHVIAYGGQFGGQGLALVEGLGTYLASVINPHQAGNMAAIPLGKFSIRMPLRRGRAAGCMTAIGDSAHHRICFRDQSIDQ